MQILVYLQTYYINYCVKRKHYNNLFNDKFLYGLAELRSMRLNELELQSIDNSLNDSIGFVPVIWLSYLFITLCITITHIATTKQSIEMSSIISIDVFLIFFTLIIVIAIVGQLNTKYDINTITLIFNKRFSSELSINENLKLEMIQYLIEASNRCYNRPKSFGLFNVNSTLILSFISSVITFSVMCAQLISQING